MIKARQRLLHTLGCSAWALSGCLSAPHLPPAPQPKSAAAYGDVSVATEASGVWPEDRWWTLYGDAQLDALMDEALQNAPTYAAAAARIRHAEALAEQNGSAILPEIAGDASVAEAKQSYNNGIPAFIVPKNYHDNSRATLGLTWDVDPWGRNRDALAAATSDALAAAADAAEARRVLTTSIAQAYADLVRAYDDRDAAVQAAQIRAETLDLVRLRRNSGLETDTSLKLNVAVERGAQADIIAIDETIDQTRDRIAALLGAGPERGRRIARPPSQQTPQIGLPAKVALDLMGRRPDIVASRLRVEAAAKRISASRKDFYPNLSLASFIGGQSLDLRDLAKKGSDIGSVGLATHLPIFEAGRLQGAYRASRADYDDAVANYDAVVSAALQEVADALASRRTVAERIERTEAALAASEDAYRSAEDRYQAQLSTYLVVLTAQDSVVANRRALADLKSRALSLDVGLIRALGGGYRDPSPVIQSKGPR